jgi:hypothetical protein
MLLVGNVDVENESQFSGVDKPITVSFVLPRDLRRDSKLKLKYFAYYMGHWVPATAHLVFDGLLEDSLLEPFTWRYVPQEIQMRVRGNGADLLSTNTGVGFVNQALPGISDTRSIDYIPFQRTMQLEAGQYDILGAEIIGDTTAWDVPPVTQNGHNSIYDMNIGVVEKNVTTIDVELTVIKDNKRDDSFQWFSGEDKVRLDSISFQIEIEE